MNYKIKKIVTFLLVVLLLFSSCGSSGNPENANYVLNKNSKKIHELDCEAVNKMNEKNKLYFSGTREEAISDGYKPCGICKP